MICVKVAEHLFPSTHWPNPLVSFLILEKKKKNNLTISILYNTVIKMTSEGRGVGSFKFQIAILLNTICSHWKVYCVLKSPYPITIYPSDLNVSGFCIRRSLPTTIAKGNLSFIPDMLYSQIQSGLYLTLNQPYVQTCDGHSKEEKMDWFVHHYVFSYHLANQRY